MRVMFIGAHQDDLELGALGALFTHQLSGDDIYYVIGSECENIPRNTTLPEETKLVLKQVSPTYNFRLELPNTRFPALENREKMRRFLEWFRPDIDMVYCPWNQDINQDHQTIAQEVERVFRYKTVLEYEIPHSCPSFVPDYYIPLNKTIMDKKMAILNIFKSQVYCKYMHPYFVEAQARMRGLQAGVELAEGFKVWKFITRASH